MLVAEQDGRIVGLRAFMRWRLKAGDRTFTAARAVDTATDPATRGQGVFTRLTSEALDLLRTDTDLIFNTPNDQSLPGYLKLGWVIVGTPQVRIRVRRPLTVLRNFRAVNAPAARPRRPRPAPAGVRAADVVDRLDATLLQPYAGIHTPRDHAYLRWRYAEASGLGYRAVTVDGTDGMAVFRVRPRGRLWEATVSEVFVRPGDRRAASRLLGRVAATSGADHVATSFPPGSAAGLATRRRAVPSPKVMTLVVRPLRDELPVDVRSLPAWGLTLGDLEVF